MNSGIYKITCSGNGKFYIGSSRDVPKRIDTHFKTLRRNTHINPHMQSSFSLYGESSFSWRLIESCDEVDLIAREQWYMDETKCYDRAIGFNNTIKADRPIGYKHTDESKLIMSLAKKGKRQTPELILKRSIALTGKKRTQEVKDKLSAMRKGEGNPMFGTKWSEEGKSERLKKLLAPTRWNKGKTAKDDPRIIKLGLHKVGVPALNRLHSKLINVESGEQWEADSLKLLAQKCPLSLASLNRLKAKTGSPGLLAKYKIETL